MQNGCRRYENHGDRDEYRDRYENLDVRSRNFSNDHRLNTNCKSRDGPSLPSSNCPRTCEKSRPLECTCYQKSRREPEDGCASGNRRSEGRCHNRAATSGGCKQLDGADESSRRCCIRASDNTRGRQASSDAASKCTSRREVKFKEDRARPPMACKSLGGGLDCRRCCRKVYHAEMQLASGTAYHKICFSCFCCRKPLEPFTFQEHCGEIFCKQCYIRNFGPQGYGYGMGAGVLQTPL